MKFGWYGPGMRILTRSSRLRASSCARATAGAAVSTFRCTALAVVPTLRLGLRGLLALDYARLVGELMHSMLAKTGLVIGIGLSLFSALPSVAAGADCNGSSPLETRVHARPDAAGYTDLGIWFGDRQQYGCAIEAFRAALKLEPESARLYYLVGLSLFSSGHPDEAVTALK